MTDDTILKISLEILGKFICPLLVILISYLLLCFYASATLRHHVSFILADLIRFNKNRQNGRPDNRQEVITKTRELVLLLRTEGALHIRDKVLISPNMPLKLEIKHLLFKLNAFLKMTDMTQPDFTGRRLEDIAASVYGRPDCFSDLESALWQFRSKVKSSGFMPTLALDVELDQFTH